MQPICAIILYKSNAMLFVTPIYICYKKVLYTFGFEQCCVSVLYVLYVNTELYSPAVKQNFIQGIL